MVAATVAAGLAAKASLLAEASYGRVGWPAIISVPRLVTTYGGAHSMVLPQSWGDFGR